MSGHKIIGRVVLDVIEASGCRGCFFDDLITGCPKMMDCSANERPDGKSVIFKAHPEVPTPPRGRNDCPQCGAGMLLLATQNKKICVDCCVTYPWALADGQKPLVEAQR